MAKIVRVDTGRLDVPTREQDRATWAIWAHLRLGRGGEAPLPDMDARRALGDKIDEGVGWFAWAQKALGLSDAYVAEQKLTTDDLRRMISERL